MGKRSLSKTKKEIAMGKAGPAAMPITQKVHSNKSATKAEICPECGMPIGPKGNCMRTYLHVRGGK